MNRTELQAVIDAHRLWLDGDGGARADLRGRSLVGVSLRYVNLSRALLREVDLTDADLEGAILDEARLRGARLVRVDAAAASFVHADISKADATGADLHRASFWRANLSYAALTGADLTEADCKDADMAGAKLGGANLTAADFSGVRGLTDPVAFLRDNCEAVAEGYIVYKSFGEFFHAPWEVKPGAVIRETVNPLPTLDCASGINVGTLAWARLNCTHPIWRCLVKWEWLPSVVVPYNSTGKLRTGWLQLLEPVK